MGRFVQIGYVRDRYMGMMKLLRWIGDRMRQRLLGIRVFRVIGDSPVVTQPDCLGCGRRSGRFYRRFLIRRKLTRYAVIVTVHDSPLLRLRRGAKGILERSDESRLRGSQRARACDHSNRGGSDDSGGGDDDATAAAVSARVGGRVRRRIGRGCAVVFAPRAMNTVGQRRWRFVGQGGHVVRAVHSRGNRGRYNVCSVACHGAAARQTVVARRCTSCAHIVAALMLRLLRR